MKRVFVFGLITVFLLAGVISCHFQRSYTLEGYVYESFSKTPLPGITIQCANLSAITNKDGFFRINPLAEKKVPILVGKHKNYTDLTDTLLLDQKVNHRDFILTAKHPMNIDLSEYKEPFSYAFSYHSAENKSLPNSIYNGFVIPIDESISITGKFMDQNKQWQSMEVIQIGFSFFEKDEYSNWNETSKPNTQALQFQSETGNMIKTAYHFFENPVLTYTMETGTFIVEGIKTTLFRVKDANDKGTGKQYEVYIVQEGENKGQVKKIISITSSTHNSPKSSSISLILRRWNEEFIIAPPQITQ